jgi:glycine cleavage system H lipoate-binding protein
MIAVNEFMKALAAAEVEYGKALQKAAKPYRDEIKKIQEKLEKSPSPVQKAIISR